MCPDCMTLPGGDGLRCVLTPEHDGLHTATDADGVTRRWPSSDALGFRPGAIAAARGEE